MIRRGASDSAGGGGMEVGWRPPGRGNGGGGGGSAPVKRALNPFLPLPGPACRSLPARASTMRQHQASTPVITLSITPHAHSMQSPHQTSLDISSNLGAVHYETVRILKSKRTHERDEIGP